MTESRTPSTAAVKPRNRKTGRKGSAEKPSGIEPVLAKPALETERREASVSVSVVDSAAFAVLDRGEMIATAAYFRAVSRRFEPGHELEDWILAEREIDVLLSATRDMRQ